jgi:YegS/Rv2252/BmrU family lipid kinase
MQTTTVKVILNPVAGGGSISRRWPEISSQLVKAGLLFDCEFTRYVGHAIEISKLASDIGYRYIIAAGGDGTVNEVANGILESPNSNKVILGVVSSGTASSFVRSLGIVQEYLLLENRKTVLIDVGAVDCWNRGRHVKRFFINETSVGFGAAIVNAWSRLPNLFGRTLNQRFRTIAGYGALVTHRNRLMKLQIGNRHEDFRGCYVVLANGQYFAGQMWIAPDARLNDGLLNMVTIGDVRKAELLRIVTKTYDGSHLRHPKIQTETVREVKIESDVRLLVEADGEIIGETPALFSVMPATLTVLV